MKKFISLLCIISLLLVFPVSCGREDEGKEGFLGFEDSLGNTVTLKERPKRVAVLFSSFADIWQTAGGEVAISSEDALASGYAPKDAVVVASGSGHSTIDTERLVASAPDLVIGTADYPSQIKACELTRSLGIPTALFRVESFEDYLSLLLIFTRILGTPENYKLYGEDVKERIDALKRESGVLTDCDMLFLRVTKSSHKAVAASEHFAPAIFTELGISDIAPKEASVGGDLLEYAIKSDPCYVFVTFMGDEEEARAYADALFKSVGWASLSATCEGRVIYLPKALFQQKPNARWIESYEYAKKQIEEHPHVN